MTSTPEQPDERLLAAHDLARAALSEITPEATVGDAAGYTVEDDGVVSLRFANRLDGYPGWFWTVSLAVVDDAEPTVLEVELLPGDDALLAPEWVPWATRLAEYQAAQAAQAVDENEDDDAVDDDDDDVDDELDDLDDLDAADFDEDGSSILHAGDVDGVDIDVLDEDAAADDEADDADESEDEGDESDEDDEDDESSDGGADDADGGADTAASDVTAPEAPRGTRRRGFGRLGFGRRAKG